MRTSLPVPSLAIIVPTTGRLSLAFTLASLAAQTQDRDRVLVMCDDPLQYDTAQTCVETIRADAKGCWCCYPSNENLGHYGHPQRNRVLDLLENLDDAPAWVWSLDDDDVATFGALDMIRGAVTSGEAAWYVFRMVGGDNSHFPGLVVPAAGPKFARGNVGTPMIVAPAVCAARFGTGIDMGHGPDRGAGYFGDWEFAEALADELGAPQHRDEIVAEIRPALVTA
jgi:hypothetical protein